MTSLLECRDLQVFYGTTLVLGPLTCSLPSHRKIAVLGPNGAGKSSLLKALLRLIPYKGSVRMQTDSVSYMAQRQEVDWSFPLTALDVVIMGLYKRMGWFRRVGEEQRNKGLAALDRVGMKEYARSLIGALSVGQQQRVFLARSLVDEETSLFLFDEPFAGVDAQTEYVIQRIFAELMRDGKSLLCVHHDLQSAAQCFEQGLLLNRELVAYGDIGEVLAASHLSRAYKMPLAV